jgi:hypothetical protein
MTLFSSLYSQFLDALATQFSEVKIYPYNADLNSAHVVKPCILMSDITFKMTPCAFIDNVDMILQVAFADTSEKATTVNIQKYVLERFEEFMVYFHGKVFVVNNCEYKGVIGKNRVKNSVSIDGLYAISRIDFEYNFFTQKSKGV